MMIVVLVETVVLAVLTVLVAGLLRAHGTVLRRLHALDGGGRDDAPQQFDLLPLVPGNPVRDDIRPEAATAATTTSAHDITGTTLDGQLASVRVVDVEQDTLLLFLSSGCASCETFWTELGVPGSIHLPSTTRLLVVPQDPEDESLADLIAMAPDGVDVVCSSAAWRDYEVPGSPHVVFVDGQTGRIRGEGTGQSLRQVAELVARSTGDASYVTGARSRKPARDADQELVADRELLAAGIMPGDPRLYGTE